MPQAGEIYGNGFDLEYRGGVGQTHYRAINAIFFSVISSAPAGRNGFTFSAVKNKQADINGCSWNSAQGDDADKALNNVLRFTVDLNKDVVLVINRQTACNARRGSSISAICILTASAFCWRASVSRRLAF